MTDSNIKRHKDGDIFDFDIIAIVGLIFSVLGICMSIIPFCGFLFPIFSGIMCGLGLKSEKYKTLAIIGLVLSFIMLGISICLTVFGFANIILAEN